MNQVIDSDDKMVQNAMSAAYKNLQHELTIAPWINDHKRQKSIPEWYATDYGEPVTLADIGRVALKVIPIAFVIGLILAAWA